MGVVQAAQVKSAINAAITQVTSLFTTFNPTTIAIDFHSVNFGLGGSGTAQYTMPYSTYKTALLSNPGQNAVQTAAYATLPVGPVGVGGLSNTRVMAAAGLALGDPTGGAATAIASSQVFGFNGGANPMTRQAGYAGIVVLNTGLMFADRNNPVNNLYDVQSVTIHEINEVLGGAGGFTSQGGSPSNFGTMDLFRYSAPNTRSYTSNLATSAYMSIDNGVTNIVRFNQENLDSGDAGDYGNPVAVNGSGMVGNVPPRVNDAFNTPFTTGTPGGWTNIGFAEFTSFQMTGFNLTALAMAPGRVWTGSSSGFWNQANWASDAAGTPTVSLPTAADDISFSAAGAHSQSTTLGQNITIRSLTINDVFPISIAPGGAFALTISGLAGTGIDVKAGAGAVTISSGLALTGNSDTINVSNVGGLSLTGGLGGTTSFTKTGTGKLTFGSSLNVTHTGGMTLQGGTLSLQLGLAAGFGTIMTTGSVIDYAAGINNAAPIQIASNTTQFQVLMGTATQSGIISQDAPGRPMEKIGVGTLVLTAANSYTGGTKVSAGTLQIGNGMIGSIHAGSDVEVLPGATLDVNLADLSTFANAINNKGTVRGINGPGTTQTLSGNIHGIGSLVQNGNGKTILTGVNSYSGGTQVRVSGTLQVGAGALASSVGSGNVSLGGSLAIHNATGGLIANNIDADVVGVNGFLATAQTGTLELSGTITNSGGGGGTLKLTQFGSGTTILSNTGNTYSGGTLVSGGTLQVGKAIAAGSVGTADISVISAGTLSLVNLIGNALTNNITNGIVGTGTVEVNSANTNTLSGALTNGAAGTLALVQKGAGTTILTSALGNTYTGGTTVSAGPLQVGNAGNTGSIGAPDGTGQSTTINVGTGARSRL